jgi:hypothetical protein
MFIKKIIASKKSHETQIRTRKGYKNWVAGKKSLRKHLIVASIELLIEFDERITTQNISFYILIYICVSSQFIELSSSIKCDYF